MTLPREMLAEVTDADRVRNYPSGRFGSVQVGGVPPEVASRIAIGLLAADRPVAITTYLGRNRRAPAVLDAIARATGLSRTAPGTGGNNAQVPS